VDFVGGNVAEEHHLFFGAGLGNEGEHGDGGTVDVVVPIEADVGGVIGV
jgi:hypothetical protein